MPPLTIALDATPLTVSTGGVARYTLELSRALARVPGDQYWLLSDQTLPPAHLLSGQFPCRPISGGPPLQTYGRAQMVALWAETGDVPAAAWICFTAPIFRCRICRRRPSVMTLHDLSPWRPDDPGVQRVRRRTPCCCAWAWRPW